MRQLRKNTLGGSFSAFVTMATRGGGEGVKSQWASVRVGGDMCLEGEWLEG